MSESALIYLLWTKNSQVLENYLAGAGRRVILTVAELCSDEVREIVARHQGEICLIDAFGAEQVHGAQEQAGRMMAATRDHLLAEQNSGDTSALIASLETELLPCLHRGVALIEHLDRLAEKYFIELAVVNEDTMEVARTVVNWARARGVPSYHLTHGLGLPRNYVVDRPLSADRVGVFGKRGTEYFLDEGIDPSRIDLVGNPAWERLHSLRQQRDACRQQMAARYGLDPSQPIVVFATTWNAQLSAFDDRDYEKEIQIMVDACRSLEARYPKLQLVVKDRWFFKDYGSELCRRTAKDKGLERIVHTTENGEELLVAADVAVAFDSNFLVEAVLVGTPAINILSDFGQLVGPSFSPEMAVGEVLPEELPGEIDHVLADPAYRAELLRRMEAARPLLDEGLVNGSASRQVAECLRRAARSSERRYPWQSLLDASDTEASQYHNWARRELFGLFSHGPRRVLDIGCGAGATGQAIREAYPQAEVFGIEMNREAAEVARKRVNKVWVGKFEEVDLAAEGVQPGSIDTVLVADVLEHMYDPWHVLTGLKPFLSPDAQIIASLPNTRNLALLEDLAGQGRWRYAAWGLLDVTHIRFFTLAEIRNFFHETGYRVTGVGHNMDARLSEFYEARRHLARQDVELGRMVLRDVTSDELRELCTFQFLVRAEPGALSDAEFAAREKGRQDDYARWAAARHLDDREGKLWEARLEDLEPLPKVHLAVLVTDDREGEESTGTLLARTMKSLGEQLYGVVSVSLVGSMPAPDGWQDSERLTWHTAQGDLLSAANARILASDADWVGVIDAGDTLAPHALLTMIEAAARHSDWQWMYADEDRFVEGTPSLPGSQPHFKPDFNLDLLRSSPYIGSFALWRRELFRRLGGYDKDRLGVEDYDLALRAVEAAGVAAAGHVADVLHHRGGGLRCRRPVAELLELGRRTVGDHLARLGVAAQVLPGLLPASHHIRYQAPAEATVSFIVTVRDRLEDLQMAMEALFAQMSWPAWELLILDAGSQDPAIGSYLSSLEGAAEGRIRVWRVDETPGIAQCRNLLAAEAAGDVLVFLDIDVIPLTGEWLPDLLALAMRPEVGAVGPRLLAADSKVRQGPLVLGMGGWADSPYTGFGADVPGYFGRAHLEQNVSAVAGGVVLTRRELFEALGGFDAGLAIRDAEIDYSLRLGEGQFLRVWTPHVSLLSKGGDSVEEWEAAVPPSSGQKDVVLRRWMPRLAFDAAYNPNLSLRQPFEPEPNPALTWDPLPWHPLPRVIAAPADEMGCGQYRIYMPMRALVEGGRVQGRVDQVLYNPVEIARQAPDSLVFQRQTEDFQIEAMERIKRHSPAFRVYELDDLVINLPGKSAHNAHMPKDINERLRRAVGLCDRFVVSTQPLADAYRGWCDEVRVVPNYLEGARWRHLTPKRRQGAKPRVGWVGGVGHQGDLEIIADVVRQLANEVDWVFMGMCPDSMKPFIKEFHPGVPFDQYPAKVAGLNLDLALAPLEIHPFNEAKSHLRLLEYGVLGYPVVCSDIYPYQGDFPVKRVANRPRAWIEAIRERIQDLEACAREGDALRQHILGYWLVEDHLDEWQAAWLP